MNRNNLSFLIFDMQKPTVVDTCALVFCYNDLLLESETEFTCFLEQVFARGYIAIDDSGLALQEYGDAAKPGAVREGLRTWVAEKVRVGEIVEVPMDLSQRKALRLLGLPNKDYKWIAIALGAESKIIATEDIDLFDPSEKKSTGARRQKVMSGSTGKVARHCKKRLGIIVTTCGGYIGAVDSVD